MKTKTLVCIYGKNCSVDSIFRRLLSVYLSNYSGDYLYCVLIDLPDFICYRAAQDFGTEEAAKKYTDFLNARFGGKFFCVMRQRRYITGKNGYMYACEEGSEGALKALWRFVNGRREEFYPVFGEPDYQVFYSDGGVGSIYFSDVAFNKNTAFGGKITGQTNGISVIEPSGIGKLSGKFYDCAAVYPDIPETVCEGTGHKGSLHGLRLSKKTAVSEIMSEGLYSAAALDKLLSVGVGIRDIKHRTEKSVKLCAPALTFEMLGRIPGFRMRPEYKGIEKFTDTVSFEMLEVISEPKIFCGKNQEYAGMLYGSGAGSGMTVRSSGRENALL